MTEEEDFVIEMAIELGAIILDDDVTVFAVKAPQLIEMFRRIEGVAYERGKAGEPKLLGGWDPIKGIAIRAFAKGETP